MHICRCGVMTDRDDVIDRDVMMKQNKHKCHHISFVWLIPFVLLLYYLLNG